jgi:hypothetical protein
MRSTLVLVLIGIMAVSANAPCSAAGNSSHARPAKSAVVRAPRTNLGFQISAPHRHPALAGRSRWLGERHYGASYYRPRYGAAYYGADYGAPYYEPEYGTAYYQAGASFPRYAPADPDAVLGTWPVLPPVPAADLPPNRVVQFPVTILYGYHPHWTVNPL